MRSLKSGLFAIALAGLVGSAAVIGCSADGGGAAIDQGSMVDPNQPDPNAGSSGSVVPMKTPDTMMEAGLTDAKKEAGPKPEAGVDAGPPPPVPGTACTTANEIAKKTCGACGKAEAVCLDDGTAKKWSDYGVCGNELAGGCTPGATQACGNCGTQTCSAFCGWGACTGQPMNSCAPGGVDLVSAGCPANTYRQRTCKADCSFGNTSLTCDPPPTYLNVAPAVGGLNSTIITFTAAQTTKRISGSCPGATLSSTVTPYNYFEIRNPTAKIATVSVFHSQAPGGGIPDTIIASYAGATAPANDTQRAACVEGVGDFGSVALTGDGNFASLTGTSAVTIPAGGSITVYSANYYAVDPANADAAIGNIKINVKTDNL
ncbi:MAG: hypothetical protein QOI41_4154, partial [Myxococcales bacterium]|nr:hypothetical protein [Myxococcales bacterium]